ncbi:T9SS type A sorting domain-containing protein [Polaribacter porphyrae]|uniref:Fibronectin type-III domain-containing protein n=1 Tax=Polaribacter porphyrae TaxID=1137780 RepID=A0A2S7WSE2_9FLAO|nr:T9SS type A sorting domain-containing protein [Polaribacter porphyrae]PQJ80517.1 hypothetical protein BTO18_15640 [Polaribacter porphyrae]
MFKYFLTFLLITSYTSFAQTESFSEKRVGSTGDFTSQPISPRSQFSHSQTIYYKEDLEFKGEINEIRFRNAFRRSKSENSGNWIVRLGHTDKEEFSTGESFLNAQTLTEVFNAGVSIDGDYTIIRFTTPFVYNGTQNLLLEVQDTHEGFTTSSTIGYRGQENFNNPPLRSKMTFTHNGKTTGVYENSFAHTQFIGNLERCPINFTLKEDIIDENQASFTIENPNEINGFQYKIALEKDDEPTDFETTENDITLSNLIPGKNYILYYKSNCDVVPTAYKKYYFNTKPLALTIPSSIDFETDTNNYYAEESQGAFIKVSDESGLNSSSKGLILNGSTDFSFYNWWDNDNDLWKTNDNFIGRVYFTLDLTQNATQPVFEFSLKQFRFSTFLRLNIDGQLQEFEYKSDDISEETTRKISVDLSDFVGKKVVLVLEHLARNYNHKSYIDDINLRNATCSVPSNINFTTTTNSITVNWNSDSTNWEIAHTKHDEEFNNIGTAIDSKTYTFSNLEKAKPYNIYIRSKCDNSNSPWLKLYKSTDPDVLEVPYENDFRRSDAFTNTDFTINHNRYSKVYQDFYKLLYLDQKWSRNTYGWTGGLDPTEDEAWNANKNFISSVYFLINATNLVDLNATITFKQHRYTNPKTSWFRVKVNGEQIGNSYNPETSRFDPYTDLTLDLSNYVGNIIKLTLEQTGFVGPSRKNSITNGGDFTILRSVNFNSPTLNIDNLNASQNSIYPNPTDNFLYIKTKQPIHKVEIYDINGKLLITNSKEENQINVSKLNNGMYFVKVFTKEKIVFHSKFIKN